MREKSIRKPSGPNPAVTVGILYCGDMGSAVGKLLRKRGLRVVTTCQGRSNVTREQALNSGVEILPTLDDVVAQSHWVFSLVLPSAAADVAQQYASRQAIRPRGSVFVEANSIDLKTLAEIERLMASQNIALVDATINGSAHRLEDHGVLHVCGSEAGGVEAIFQGLVRVNPLGSKIGSASLTKLLMSVLAKGFAGLFLEVGVLADRAGMLESFLKSCQLFYPDFLTAAERMLPTYPRHAARRVEEMREIEGLAQELQVRLGMTHEGANWIKLIADHQWGPLNSDNAAAMRTVIQSVANACPREGSNVTKKGGLR